MAKDKEDQTTDQVEQTATQPTTGKKVKKPMRTNEHFAANLAVALPTSSSEKKTQLMQIMKDSEMLEGRMIAKRDSLKADMELLKSLGEHFITVSGTTV